MTARGTARRYAHALFDLALERDQAEAVRQELRAAAATVAREKELCAVLDNAAVSGDRKKAIAAAVWPAGEGPAGLVARLLQMLAARHRMSLLPLVADAYGRAWNARRGVVSARLASAVALSPAQLEELRRAVRQRTGRDVEFEPTIDARLLGGVRLTMDGRVYDGSVQARLAALHARLAAARSTASGQTA